MVEKVTEQEALAVFGIEKPKSLSKQQKGEAILKKYANQHPLLRNEKGNLIYISVSTACDAGITLGELNDLKELGFEITEDQCFCFNPAKN